MKRTTLKRVCLGTAVAIAVAAPFAQAADPIIVRIGDIDGFGYGAAAGHSAAAGGPANVDGLGVLTENDFLPDIDGNGLTRSSRDTTPGPIPPREYGDNFDHRSAAEIANTAITLGPGAVDTGTTGSKWTDISVSDTYVTTGGYGENHLSGGPLGGGGVFGAGGAFPDPAGQAVPNEAEFRFLFNLSKAVYDKTTDSVFFELVFGDYDVTPAELQLSYHGGAPVVVALQEIGMGDDGLIDRAYVQLNENALLVDAGANWSGDLAVKFVAPNEPYSAFDFVQLTTVVPESSTMAVSGVVALGMLGYAIRRRMVRR